MPDSGIVNFLLGSGGTAGLTLILILTGLLVPVTFYKRVLDQNAKLQEANDVLRRALDEERAQKSRLLDSNGLTNQLVSALIHQTTGRAPVAPDPEPPRVAPDLGNPSAAEGP